MKTAVQLQLEFQEFRWMLATEAHVDGATLETAHSRGLKTLESFTTKVERPRALHEELAKAASSLASKRSELRTGFQQCPWRCERTNPLRQAVELFSGDWPWVGQLLEFIRLEA